MSNLIVQSRSVHSFVLRQGRMTKAQKHALNHYFSLYVQPLTRHVLDTEKMFGRKAPLIIEIGFGMGQALLTMAAAYPEQNYLGIEVHRPGVGSLLAGLTTQQINNVRVFNEDAVLVLNQSIAKASVSAVYIFFPDPWPKKRHHKRRLIQPHFIQLVHSRLLLGGLLHLATDCRAYADQMLAMLSGPLWVNQAGPYQFHPRPRYRPLTKFEQRGQKQGHQIYDLLFCKQ